MVMAAQDLVIFTLGPVQSFIATARRTQDLWLGSQLLSHLALVGVERAASVSGAEMLYPVQLNSNWPQSIPNRFVVSIPAGQGKKVGETIAAAVERAWRGAADQAYGYFEKLAPESGWQAPWERQVVTWLETYWVAWPWNGEDYGTAYCRAGLALDARKRIRPYPTKPEPGEKCTLCGIRQALHGKQDRYREAIRDFWRRIAAHRDVTSAELREGERLCAVCTIKRFADKAQIAVNGHRLDTDRFPSTSSIATATFKAALLKHWAGLKTLVIAHLDALDALNEPGDKHRIQLGTPDPFPRLKDELKKRPGSNRLLYYDGDFFYRETFTPERLKEILGRDPDETSRREALDALDSLLQAAADSPYCIAPPHTYLAAVALDGDWMGKLLSECTDPAQHKAISIALTTFASKQAPAIVENDHPGRLVYAGGDDVLALLPVSDALAVADELRQALTDVLKRAGHPDRTASAGIAIVHHMHPLEGALRAARQAEEKAKAQAKSEGGNGYGRNAVVIDVVRRSGERRQVGMNWSYPGDVLQALAPITKVQLAIAENNLSGKLTHEVDHEAPILAGRRDDVDRLIPPDARKAELKRLFRRHAAEGKESDAEVLAGRIADLAEQITWPEMADWLLLARFLAQGGGER
jgi:CRISPR-associated protein Cmr2